MDFSERCCKQSRYHRLNHIRFYKNRMDVKKITSPMLNKIAIDIDYMLDLENDKILNENVSQVKKDSYQKLILELEGLKTYFNNEKMKR